MIIDGGCRTKCAAPFLVQKITARPRKNPAVGVKLSYATN